MNKQQAGASVAGIICLIVAVILVTRAYRASVERQQPQWVSPSPTVSVLPLVSGSQKGSK